MHHAVMQQQKQQNIIVFVLLIAMHVRLTAVSFVDIRLHSKLVTELVIMSQPSKIQMIRLFRECKTKRKLRKYVKNSND